MNYVSSKLLERILTVDDEVNVAEIAPLDQVDPAVLDEMGVNALSLAEVLRQQYPRR